MLEWDLASVPSKIITFFLLELFLLPFQSEACCLRCGDKLVEWIAGQGSRGQGIRG